MLLKRLISKLTIGAFYEHKAKRYLISKGLVFITQNYSCRYGEIDLIFAEPNTDTLVFVEVRFRASTQFGGAAASITKQKQQKVKKAALFYLAQRRIDPKCRFDVIAIERNDINWIQSAFS